MKQYTTGMSRESGLAAQLLGLLARTFPVVLASLWLSPLVMAQIAPDSFATIEREARETVTMDLPQYQYLPGYFFNGEADRDYLPGTVYRVEYGVTNDGTRSQIPETFGFRLTAGGTLLVPQVRDVRGGGIREPFDEVVVVRLIDGANDNQLKLCTDDNTTDPNQSCNNVANPNKNSFFHAYTAGHRTQSDASEACSQAYSDFGLTAPNPVACPIVRFQSERVTCFKCVVNNFALHRGADNVFSKSNVERTRNNIGRIDLILRHPIVITQAQEDDFKEVNGVDASLLDNIGFLITERGGNDNIAVAAIKQIADLDGLAGDSSNTEDLAKLARLIRSYDNEGLVLDNDGVGLITPGRVAQSLVTQLGSLVKTSESIGGGDNCPGTFWASTGATTQSAVFMNSNPAVNPDFFIENRPDQDLTSQTICGAFLTLAQLGIEIGDDFHGVSLFAGDVESTNDLITLKNILRLTPGASAGGGGLDLMGGGGIFGLPGSISGKIEIDTTNNGDGDIPHVGVLVALLYKDGSPVLGLDQNENTIAITTETDESGAYTFSGLPSGEYKVRQTVPDNYTAIVDQDGGDLSVIGDVTLIEVNFNQDITDRDFVNSQEATAVVLGDVDLTEMHVAELLHGLGAQEMDAAGLSSLLRAWDPVAADRLIGADRPALLEALRDYLDPNGHGRVAVLRWETLEEIGTMGFYVDRRDGRDWTRINSTMLPAMVGAHWGGEYWLADPGARPGGSYQYRLIEIEARGTTQEYGPFELRMGGR